MKKIIALAVISIIIIACKSDKEQTQPEKIVELSVAEKIANRYGLENWNDVNTIKFTFNVDRDSSHFERSWEWSPKTNDVVLTSNTNTTKFNRAELDSTNINADKAFINDKYWLLTPFNLVWDSGTTISEPTKESASLSNKELNKITLTYPNQGGYTPGDAYDFYYNDDYIIEEWVYRKGNAQAPSMMTTWENNQNFNGIIIPMSYKKTSDNWELYFTDVVIE